ncbi:hypothetical protein ACFY00_16135 [Kitasatospora sp. NPDC001540]|uniref:hypothetical protein n=1 Tax=Kitasatospora sp. NPDC001540 TaxID=3364014 RepID=UPI0036A6C7B4
MRWIPTTRFGRVLAAGTIGPVLAAVLLWNVPLAGQGRGEPALTQLLPQSPPGPGPWESYPKGMDLPERGLVEQDSRNFVPHGNDFLRHGFSQRVRRFASPTWAWLCTHRRRPSESDKPWTYQSIRLTGSSEADDQSYTCLIRDKTFTEEGREDWYGELRYGQYVVDIAVIGREQTPRALDLLQQAVRATDGLMPE